MLYTAEFIEIAPFIAENVNPEKVLKRTTDEVWQVRSAPVDFTAARSDPAAWTRVTEGELVRILLIPYRTRTQDLAEFGLSVMDMAQRTFVDFPRVVRSHIVFGKPVEDLRPEAEAFRYWVGLALQLR